LENGPENVVRTSLVMFFNVHNTFRRIARIILMTGVGVFIKISAISWSSSLLGMMS